MIPILLLGVPGAGKGTQAKRLAQRYQIPHLSTGEMFRQLAESGSELGQRVWKDVKEGNLVPDDVVCQVVEQRLRQPDCSRGYILDGFPRTVPQAEWLKRHVFAGGSPNPEAEPIVVYLSVGYNDLYRRLMGRRSCPKCGRIYNDFTQPPRVAGLCDLDRTPLVQRKDDDPAVIRERLSAYEERTLPLIDFFRGRSRWIKVNGAEPVERVSERLFAALDGVMAERGGGARPVTEGRI